MRTWQRRIRGAIGMGITWAAAWFAAGSIPRWVFGVETDAPLPLVFGVFGFIAGMVFSAVLVVAEGRRGFGRLSLPRFAGWGAVGGLLLAALVARVGSLGWGEMLALAPTLALASAACAAASLAIARRATRGELPNGRGHAAEVGPIDHASRKLPGGDG
jgi:hypothetical protein